MSVELPARTSKLEIRRKATLFIICSATATWILKIAASAGLKNALSEWSTVSSKIRHRKLKSDELLFVIRNAKQFCNAFRGSIIENVINTEGGAE
jgi:hypothetical protein